MIPSAKEARQRFEEAKQKARRRDLTAGQREKEAAQTLGLGEPETSRPPLEKPNSGQSPLDLRLKSAKKKRR